VTIFTRRKVMENICRIQCCKNLSIQKVTSV